MDAVSDVVTAAHTMTRRAAPITGGCFLAGCVGAAIPGQPIEVPIAVAGLLLYLGFSLVSPLPWLGYALFVSTLLTRLRIPAFGTLPEQALLLMSIASLIVRGRLSLVLRAFRLLPLSAWLFVIWGAGVSIVRSPDVLASLRISAWIASSLLVASLVAEMCGISRMSTAGIVARLVSITSIVSLVGVLAWIIASLDSSFSIGVQTESLTGAPAAFGFALEANIFGGICAIWLVLDVLYTRQAPHSRVLVRTSLVLGVLASLTRAAALGAAVGILVGSLADRRSRRLGASALLVGSLTVGGLFLVGPTVPMLRPLVEKGTQVLDLESSTSIVRRKSWDLALGDLSMFDTLVGQGVNSFGQRHEDPSRPSENVPGYLGNLFLQIIYDAGLVGVAMLGAAGLRIVRRLTRDTRTLGVAACGAIVGVATSPLWLANWWVVAAVAALAARRRTPGAGWKRRVKPRRVRRPSRAPLQTCRG